MAPAHDPSEPWPLARADIEPLLARLRAGAPFRGAIEELLRGLDPGRAAELLQLHAERRGAWLTLLRERAGRALVVGNALTGAVSPLGTAGFRVTLADRSPERLELARRSAERAVPGGVRAVRVEDGARLPFADRSFDLVVLDDDARPGPGARELAEARRVCAGELVVLCDNRLAYKRSSGRWRELSLASPLGLLRRALLPRDGELTLAGHRRALAAPGFDAPRALALYPDRRDFAHVVGLDGDGPELHIGPNEARNRLKLAAHRAGLFPLLAPSFALVARRADRPEAPRRVDRLLAELARATGEPAPRVEHVFATRGNTSVILTAVPGRDARDPAGRWTLHVPLYRPHAPGLVVHLEALRLVRARFPAVPVPEPLFHGEVESLWISLERRVPGVPGQHLAGDPRLADRMLLQAAEHLAQLVVEPARPLDEQGYAELVAARFELVARAADDETRRALARMEREARAALLAAELPRVVQHGDLRAKHVLLARDGAVLGYVDWGTATLADLPGFDLAHLLVHDMKQRTGEREGAIWRRLLARAGLRAAERDALELHRRALGLDVDVARALLAIYPVVVGAIAEANWPWSRPGWFRGAFAVHAPP
jgi:aminoglycoside phosphotransferase (APT) family kinase protein